MERDPFSPPGIEFTQKEKVKKPRKSKNNDKSEELQKIIDEYVDGQSISAIASKYGYGISTVHKWLKDSGVETREPGKMSVQKRIELHSTAIIRDYLSGISVTELMAKHRIGHKTIMAIFEQKGMLND